MVVGASSCTPPATTQSQADAQPDAWANFDDANALQLSSPGTPSIATAAESQPTLNASTTLLGARHDLQLRGDVQPSCQCLQVAYGTTDKPAFSWAANAPNLEPNQWAVAFREAPCDKAHAPLSYRGFERKGADIVVRIEAASAGRPRVTGAIIPKPSGRLLIQPSSISTGHGLPLKGKGPSCVVADVGSIAPATKDAPAKARAYIKSVENGRGGFAYDKRRPNFDDQPPPVHLTQ